MKSTERVAGEPVDVLFEALQRVEVRKGQDGILTGEFRLEPALGAPLFRALNRVEAELARADEALVGTDPARLRSAEQRLADAFVELALAVSAAVFIQQAA